MNANTKPKGGGSSVRRIGIAVLLSLSIAAFPYAAHAELVTFYFQGPAVTSDLGDFVTGSVTFDTSTPHTPITPLRYWYADAVVSLSFSTNGVAGISRTFNCGDIQAWDDWSGTLDLLIFFCDLGPAHSYHLGTFGVDMLTSLDLPTQPPVGERVDFHWNDELNELAVSSNSISWVRPATIDIKPGNKRNAINPRSRGGIWVAVLSDSEFDPLQIKIPTVRFGPDKASAIRHRVRDVNRDGLGDLVLRFSIRKTGIECGDTEATLTGETFDGQVITGTDTIKTVGC